MVLRISKIQYLKLKKEISELEEAKRLLEERKKELTGMYKKQLILLKEFGDDYNLVLKELKELTFDFVIKHDFFEVLLDRRTQNQITGSLEKKFFLRKPFTSLQSVNWPDLKGDSVPLFDKNKLKDALNRLLELGTRLDTEVKRTHILRLEIQKTSRKFAYLDKVAIPKLKEEIKMIKAMLEEKERAELMKIKTKEGKG